MIDMKSEFDFTGLDKENVGLSLKSGPQITLWMLKMKSKTTKARRMIEVSLKLPTVLCVMSLKRNISLRFHPPTKTPVKPFSLKNLNIL